MFTPILLLSFLFLLLSKHNTCNAANHIHDHPLCAASSCGNLNISYPFRLKEDPQNCGDHKYQLSCENNVTLLYLHGGKYHVHAINYHNYTIRIADSGLQINNCSSLPLHSLNFTNEDPYETYQYFVGGQHSPIRKIAHTIHLHALPSSEPLSRTITFMTCPRPMSSPLYVKTSPCINGTLYAVIGPTSLFEVEDSCKIELMFLTSWPESDNDSKKKKKEMTYMDVHNQLVYGFELSWLDGQCDCIEYCFINKKGQVLCEEPAHTIVQIIHTYIKAVVMFVATLTGLFLGLRFLLFGLPFLVTVLIYKWRRRHVSMFNSIEDFLKLHNNLMPIRYGHRDIKRMTNNFKHKLGEGGFGSVYKGKLRSGSVVAVKVLRNSKGNGQDFINEVGTIGRIHHMNVVKLVGYYAGKTKRALVYEFMVNGSLEKYLFQRDDEVVLSCKQMYQIALGVARGIEYLHRGCEMQILHFDIKPHNILLDANFNPKLSDFRLAKLYPAEKDNVTLTTARGTMGYMAPELFYNNIGKVSSKADVYSFGMLLMEMAGRRKNLNVFADCTSQIYFPSWIYEQLVQEKEMNTILVDIETEEESKMVKKMVMVGLWCVQMKPEDRPSMSRVVGMLEGEVECLEVPPKNPVEMDRASSDQAALHDSEDSSSLNVTCN